MSCWGLSGPFVSLARSVCSASPRSVIRSPSCVHVRVTHPEPRGTSQLTFTPDADADPTSESSSIHCILAIITVSSCTQAKRKQVGKASPTPAREDHARPVWAVLRPCSITSQSHPTISLAQAHWRPALTATHRTACRLNLWAPARCKRSWSGC